MRPIIVSKAVEATAGQIVDPSGELRKYGVQGTDIPSAATIDLGAASGDYVRVTGTTNISSFGVAPAGVIRTVEFTGILNLIYNSATMVLPGALNLKTSPNDIGAFRSRGSGAWINTGGVWQGSPVLPANGGTGLTTVNQGDMLYAGEPNVYYRLPKSTVATRYLSNQGGVTNNPKWDLVDLATGVTGVLSAINGGGSQIPVGGMLDFAGSTNPPTGWLLCFGQAVSRTTYAALFTVIGVVYGGGDGSVTFNLPDCRGRVVTGKDDMGGIAANRIGVAGRPGGISAGQGALLGAVGGSEQQILLETELAAHNHSMQAYLTSAGGAALAAGAGVGFTVNPTGVTGSGYGHNNVQPTIIMNKIIRY